MNAGPILSAQRLASKSWRGLTRSAFMRRPRLAYSQSHRVHSATCQPSPSTSANRAARSHGATSRRGRTRCPPAGAAAAAKSSASSTQPRSTSTGSVCPPPNAPEADADRGPAGLDVPTPGQGCGRRRRGPCVYECEIAQAIGERVAVSIFQIPGTSPPVRPATVWSLLTIRSFGRLCSAAASCAAACR